MASINVETLSIGPIETNCYVVWPDGDDACWIIDLAIESIC